MLQKVILVLSFSCILMLAGEKSTTNKKVESTVHPNSVPSRRLGSTRIRRMKQITKWIEKERNKVNGYDDGYDGDSESELNDTIKHT